MIARSTIRRRRWTWPRLLVLAVATVVGFVVTVPTARLRYLALPVLHDPSVPSAAVPRAIADAPPSGATLVTRLPSRVSAVLPRSDGSVFIGTFDEGLFRFDPARGGAPVAVGGLEGRERFVDALVEHDGRVIAATHRGAVVVGGDGTRLGVLAPGEAISSLAVVDGALVAGSARGLWTGASTVTGSPVTGSPLGERGPTGEILRVTALAVTRARLYVGTPDGVYVLQRPLTAQVARWQPLVFGAPPAETNVVTALAPLGDGVVAGTDDGGLVLVRDDGVSALPLTEARANDVNPGAMAHFGGTIFVGTEGAGLLQLAGSDVTRPSDWRRARISAVAAGARLFLGTEDGELWALPAAQPLAASRIFWINAS
ncbi:MAG: Vault protein inter-alpha-trypsin domain protein [Myxococcales bacterium]|nr:Vault protein inter-alpha-trypsin domain protein [Myxococcales bacterium]